MGLPAFNTIGNQMIKAIINLRQAPKFIMDNKLWQGYLSIGWISKLSVFIAIVFSYTFIVGFFALFTSSETTAFCEPTSSSNCVEIDFNDYTVNSYGGSQDNGTYTDVGGGAGIAIHNNAWKSILLNYTVTSNTVIEFQFGSTAGAEIHGIGFDNNNSISSGFTFQLYGTQNWGNRDFDYTTFGSWQTFTIPVGQYYIGTFDRLFFVDDNDANPTTGNSYFKNIKIYEGASCNPLQDEDVAIATRNGNTAMIDGLPDEVGASFIHVFPNPANDIININIESTIKGTSQVSLYSLMGQLVQQQDVTLEKGGNSISLTTDNLQSGTYIVRLKVGDSDLVEKISVIK